MFELLAELIAEAKEIVLGDGSERVAAFAGGVFWEGRGNWRIGLNWGEIIGVYKLDLSRLAGMMRWKVSGFGKHGRVVVEEMPGLKGSL